MSQKAFILMQYSWRTGSWKVWPWPSSSNWPVELNSGSTKRPRTSNGGMESPKPNDFRNSTILISFLKEKDVFSAVQVRFKDFYRNWRCFKSQSTQSLQRLSKND